MYRLYCICIFGFQYYPGPCSFTLTLSNPIFLPPEYSPALIYFGWQRGRWITCNYPTVLKEKNRSRKSTTCTICWLKYVLHEENGREQENHNVGRGLTYDRKVLTQTTYIYKKPIYSLYKNQPVKHFSLAILIPLFSV
jgi:hypothetical protein